MNPFRPADIRLILLLSVLALAGSVVLLLQKNAKLSRFKLDALADRGGYKYSYTSADLGALKRDSASAGDPAVEVPGDPSDKIDLNNCGYYDLESLPGIGPALAERIIQYRDSVGPFRNADDLTRVKGIGPAKLALIRDRVIAR